VGDPTCSWCYGFTEEINKPKAKYEDSVEFRLVVGGLRSGPGDTPEGDHRDFLRDHWQKIHKKTGQPFQYGILKDSSFSIYITEPADRAVVTVRQLRPDSTLVFFQQLQAAFYAENKDPLRMETYLPLVKQVGIPPEKFKHRYRSDSLKKATWKDFEKAWGWGAEAFPTVFLRIDGELKLVTKGYETFEKMDERVNNLLQGRESLWHKFFK
jgi:putative protein-disulfide isomerase